MLKTRGKKSLRSDSTKLVGKCAHNLKEPGNLEKTPKISQPMKS